MSFNDRLKEARKKKGFTQTQLGEAIGVGKTTIAGYESGKREPDVNKIYRMMAALDIEANSLTQEEMHETDPRGEISLTLRKAEVSEKAL